MNTEEWKRSQYIKTKTGLNQSQENAHQSLHYGRQKVRLHIYTLHLLSIMYTSFWKINLERKKKLSFFACFLSRIIFYALMPQITFLTYVHKIKLRMLSTFVQLCTTVFTMCINSLSIEFSCTELVKLFFISSIRVYVFMYMNCHKLCLLRTNVVWFLSSCSERVCLMYRSSQSDGVWCPIYKTC